MIIDDLIDRLPGSDVCATNQVFNENSVTWSVEDDLRNPYVITVQLKLISRIEALVMLHEEDTSRLRNYEIEQELHERFDIGYFIPDVCPFNGFSIYEKPVN
jgi:hypothetical protein